MFWNAELLIAIVLVGLGKTGLPLCVKPGTKGFHPSPSAYIITCVLTYLSLAVEWNVPFGVQSFTEFPINSMARSAGLVIVLLPEGSVNCSFKIKVSQGRSVFSCEAPLRRPERDHFSGWPAPNKSTRTYFQPTCRPNSLPHGTRHTLTMTRVPLKLSCAKFSALIGGLGTIVKGTCRQCTLPLLTRGATPNWVPKLPAIEYRGLSSIVQRYLMYPSSQ